MNAVNSKREFFTDNFLVRIHFIIEIVWWTGLAPWDSNGTQPGGGAVRAIAADLAQEGGLGPARRVVQGRPCHRERVLYYQPTGLNPLYHRDDWVDRPRAMGV